MAEPTYLDAILAYHRRHAAADARNHADLLGEAAAFRGSEIEARGFKKSIQMNPSLGVIAEVKRRSPSKGDISADLDPVALVRNYELGGACCISVLTDTPHFGGSAQDLVLGAACSLPVLRKDFTVAPNDVCDACLMGADAVLLIVAALSDAELVRLTELCALLGLDSLVEVHDERELERALGVGAGLIGVNQRDLVTFEVDTERALRLAGMMPAEVLAVAESGIGNRVQAEELAQAGYVGVLVGEHLVKSQDPASSVAELASVKKPANFR